VVDGIRPEYLARLYSAGGKPPYFILLPEPLSEHKNVKFWSLIRLFGFLNEKDWMVGPPGFEPGTNPQMEEGFSHPTGYERRQTSFCRSNLFRTYLRVRGQTELRAHDNQKILECWDDLNVF